MISSPKNRHALHKERQQEIFDAWAQRPPLFLRSIGREREHWLGFGFYRYLHNLKTKKILDGISLIPGTLMLDVGCNDGEMLNMFHRAYGIKGVGLDFSMGALKAARRYNFFNNRYCQGDADNLPFKENSFDNVICFSLLEHIPAIESCLKEIGRVLKKGGKLIIYTLNSKYKYTWYWFKKKIFLTRYDYEPGAGEAHNPAYFLDSDCLKGRLSKNRIRVNKTIYFHAFFTMLYDDLGQRTIYRLVCLLYLNKNYFNRKKGLEGIKPDIILRLYNWWLKVILPLLEFLDRPLAQRGYSNGFYILAEKK